MSRRKKSSESEEDEEEEQKEEVEGEEEEEDADEENQGYTPLDYAGDDEEVIVLIRTEQLVFHYSNK